MRRALAAAFFLTLLASVLVAPPAGGAAPPPLGISGNVHYLGNVPGAAIGMHFKGHYAYVTGPTGVTVLDIIQPANPQVVGVLPLPHFENEDVDLCGNTLLVSNDRAAQDLGSILYVIDITVRTQPKVLATLPLGLTGQGRGAGHIANYVKSDCSQAWIDGGNLVEVVSLKIRSAPRSLGKFESVASLSDAFKVTHDTELDSQGVSWSVGGGGAAGYRVTDRPLHPRLVYRTTQAGINPSPLNDFILHNSKRRGDTLLITEEDYLDTDETPPGGCRGQGKFETWRINADGRVTPLDTWQTEANELAFSGSSKAPLTVNCSSHWFEQKGGIAAVGWYEQGVRFLDARSPGNIRQVGYYLPANGSTWAAYWSPTDPTGQIVYTADAYRGVDVLRIDGGGQSATAKTAPRPSAWYGTLTTAYSPSDPWGWSCVINLGGTATASGGGTSGIRAAARPGS